MGMNDIYTIFSNRRTGSHMILEMLAGTPYRKGGLTDAYGLWLPLNEKEARQHIKDQNVVIHLHEIDLIKDLDPSLITSVISLRKNVFAQSMSHVVATVVKEWSGKDYTNKTVDPVEFDPIKYITVLKLLHKWKNNLDVSKYKKVVTIYYEDLVQQGAEFLAHELGLNYDESKVGHVYQKSPYSYKDIILNWEELYQEYLKFTKQD
jgi:hypothetical protein